MKRLVALLGILLSNNLSAEITVSYFHCDKSPTSTEQLVIDQIRDLQAKSTIKTYELSCAVDAQLGAILACDGRHLVGCILPCLENKWTGLKMRSERKSCWIGQIVVHESYRKNPEILTMLCQAYVAKYASLFDYAVIGMYQASQWLSVDLLYKVGFKFCGFASNAAAVIGRPAIVTAYVLDLKSAVDGKIEIKEAAKKSEIELIAEPSVGLEYLKITITSAS